jgi:hypothetical protein
MNGPLTMKTPNVPKVQRVIVLGKSDPNSDAGIVLAGWGLAGPKRVHQAIEQACVMAGVSADQATRMTAIDSIWGKLDAAGPLFSCIAAVRALLRGETRHILITDDRGDCVSSAVLFSAKRTGESHCGS